jgi:hypothetical protein
MKTYIQNIEVYAQLRGLYKAKGKYQGKNLITVEDTAKMLSNFCEYLKVPRFIQHPQFKAGIDEHPYFAVSIKEISKVGEKNVIDGYRIYIKLISDKKNEIAELPFLGLSPTQLYQNANLYYVLEGMYCAVLSQERKSPKTGKQLNSVAKAMKKQIFQQIKDYREKNDF